VKKIPLKFFFLLALLFIPVGTVFFPYLRLFPFAPFLAIAFHRLSLIKALFISFFCGLILDLFSFQFPFGSFAFCHLLTTLILYFRKNHFFEDKPIPFALYSSLISSVLSLTLIFCICIPTKLLSPSFSLLISDALFMPLVDGLYAFFWFMFPSISYRMLKKWIYTWKLSHKDS
jgi:hypothetical protein